MNPISLIDFGEYLLSTELAPEIFSSLIIVLIICVLCIIVNIQARHHDPLKKPTGLLFLFDFGVTFFDNLVDNMMGKRFKGFGGFIMAIAMYTFLSFIWGLTGLPAPSNYLAVPLSLGLITFVLIHATSVKYTKWSYFKRYIDPFPVMLPINLISMWAPLLSLTFRMFGNALAGWTLMSVTYWAFNNLADMVLGSILPVINGWSVGTIFIAPIVTPVLHAYFDLFSGFIQTTVFLFLTMIFVASEAPEEEIEEVSMKGGR